MSGKGSSQKGQDEAAVSASKDWADTVHLQIKIVACSHTPQANGEVQCKKRAFFNRNFSVLHSVVISHHAQERCRHVHDAVLARTCQAPLQGPQRRSKRSHERQDCEGTTDRQQPGR